MADTEKFKWQNARVHQRAELLKLLDDETMRRDVFNDKFLEGLEKRRDALNAKSNSIQIIQWSIMLVLAVALLSVHISISIFGVSTAEARNLREILLVGASSIQLMNTLSMIEHANLTELLQVLVAKMSNGNETAARALRIRFGLGGGSSTTVYQGGRTVGLKQIPTVVMGCLGLLGGIVLLLLLVISVQAAAMWDILKDPTISPRVSFWVVTYVLLVDAATISLTVMNSTTFAATEAVVERSNEPKEG